MSLLDALLNEAYHDPLEIFIARRIDAVGGSGTIDDPYDWSAQAKFDALMGNAPVNATIHLGAGLFQTQGYNAFLNQGWQPKAGQKIRGSGIDVTTLQLINASGSAAVTLAIGCQYDNFCAGFEASDFTVDCNLGGQPVPQGVNFAPVACGAFSVPGRDVRIRRIRVIHFGTQTLNAECFAIGIGNAHPLIPEVVNCVIEDCVLQYPSDNNVRETTILGILGTESTGEDDIFPWHRACVFRNCHLNCDYQDGVSSLRIAIASLELVPGTQRQYQVTTKVPHLRTTSNNVVLNLVRVQIDPPPAAPVPSAVFNGAFKVDWIDPVDPTVLRFTLPADPESGARNLDWAFVGVTFQAIGGGGGTAQIFEGNSAWNVLTGGPYSDTGSTKDLTVRDNYYSNIFIGPFFQPGGTTSTSLSIALSSLDRSGTTAIATTIYPHGFMAGSTPDRVIIAGVTGPDAGKYNGTFPVTAPAARDGSLTFQYGPMTGTPSGPAQGAPGYFTEDKQRRLKSLTYVQSGGAFIATAETTAAHGLDSGDAVLISKAKQTLFNGFFSITKIDNTHFSYALAGNPDPPGTSGSSPSGYWGRLAQVRRATFESNTMDLALAISQYGAPAAASLYGDSARISPYIHRQSWVRDNVIRHFKDLSDSPATPFSTGLFFVTCENVDAEGNMIKLDTPTPISFISTGKLEVFGNATPAGAVIEGIDLQTGTLIHGLERDVEDALVMSLF